MDTRRGLRECFRSALCIAIIWHNLRFLYRCHSGQIIYRRYHDDEQYHDDDIELIAKQAIMEELENNYQAAMQSASAPQGAASSQPAPSRKKIITNQWLGDLWQMRNLLQSKEKEVEDKAIAQSLVEDIILSQSTLGAG